MSTTANARTGTTESMQPLHERLAALERRGRRIHLAWSVIAAVLLILALSPRQGPVEAAAFVVRDGAGRARIRIGLAGDVPALSLYDGAGALRAALAVDAEGPILNLFAADGAPRLVAAERAARAFVVLRDADGAPRAAMAVQESGEPSLYLLDADLKPIWRQPAQGPAQR